MANNSNKRSIEATFSELLDKIQKLTASNLRRLEELVEQGVYIPGSNPDDNGEINLPNGKRDETRKSPTKPVKPEAGIEGGEMDADAGIADDFGSDAIDADSIDADAVQAEAPAEAPVAKKEESTEDPEVKNAQVADDRVQDVEVRQLEDFDDGYSMDIFADDGTVCEDEDGNEECLVVSLNGLHCNDGDCGIDSFETTIAPIYDANGNIDEIALRDAAIKRACEVLDCDVTDADTIVLQTKQDANRKMEEGLANLAFLPGNFYAEENSPTTVLFPNGNTSELAQIIGNNPILDPVPAYVKDADDPVMPPTCIGSSQNADWAPYVCLVKRPALLGGFSISIAMMSDADLGEDKHAIGLRNKGIKELHNDLQTFAKYHDGRVINRPKAGTDAESDADDENCICTYKSVPKDDDIDDIDDDQFFMGESDGEGGDGVPKIDAEAEIERVKSSAKTPDDANAEIDNAKAKAAEAKAGAEAAVSGTEASMNQYVDDSKNNLENDTQDAADAVSEIANHPDVKNGVDIDSIPKDDNSFMTKFGDVSEADGDDGFEEEGDIVPDDEEGLVDYGEDTVIAELPFPGFKVGDGENKMFLDIIERVFRKDGDIYRKVVTRISPDRKIGPEQIASAVCDDKDQFMDICNTIAEDWVAALNDFLQADAFRFDGPVDIGPEGFDDQVFAVVEPEFADQVNIEAVDDGEVPKDVILRNVFDGRTEEELFDDVIVETRFVDSAAADVSNMLLTKHYNELVDALTSI